MNKSQELAQEICKIARICIAENMTDAAARLDQISYRVADLPGDLEKELAECQASKSLFSDGHTRMTEIVVEVGRQRDEYKKLFDDVTVECRTKSATIIELSGERNRLREQIDPIRAELESSKRQHELDVASIHKLQTIIETESPHCICGACGYTDSWGYPDGVWWNFECPKCKGPLELQTHRAEDDQNLVISRRRFSDLVSKEAHYDARYLGADEPVFPGGNVSLTEDRHAELLELEKLALEKLARTFEKQKPGCVAIADERYQELLEAERFANLRKAEDTEDARIGRSAPVITLDAASGTKLILIIEGGSVSIKGQTAGDENPYRVRV